MNVSYNIVYNFAVICYVHFKSSEIVMTRSVWLEDHGDRCFSCGCFVYVASIARWLKIGNDLLDSVERT